MSIEDDKILWCINQEIINGLDFSHCHKTRERCETFMRTFCGPIFLYFSIIINLSLLIFRFLSLKNKIRHCFSIILSLSFLEMAHQMASFRPHVKQLLMEIGRLTKLLGLSVSMDGDWDALGIVLDHRFKVVTNFNGSKGGERKKLQRREREGRGRRKRNYKLIPWWSVWLRRRCRSWRWYVEEGNAIFSSCYVDKWRRTSRASVISISSSSYF